MIKVEIPGWGMIEVEHLVIDLNGTLATDGKIPSEVKKKINDLAEKVTIYVLTADTQGTANSEVEGVEAELVTTSPEDSGEAKFEFLKTLDLDKTAVIGNGSNDQRILKEASLGIAVLGTEGMSAFAMKNADLFVKEISDALDLFLKPKRLIATLRE
jgi:P-type E1-E2 ATPase